MNDTLLLSFWFCTRYLGISSLSKVPEYINLVSSRYTSVCIKEPNLGLLILLNEILLIVCNSPVLKSAKEKETFSSGVISLILGFDSVSMLVCSVLTKSVS